MGFPIGLVGCAVALALMGAGLAYVFAPAAAQDFLKSLAASVGIIIVGIVVIVNTVQTLHPLASLFALTLIRPIAYLLRRRRIRRPQRPQRLRAAERTPVMPPRHLGGGI
jgi:accessory gene regulator protein AgrB